MNRFFSSTSHIKRNSACVVPRLTMVLDISLYFRIVALASKIPYLVVVHSGELCPFLLALSFAVSNEAEYYPTRCLDMGNERDRTDHTDLFLRLGMDILL